MRLTNWGGLQEAETRQEAIYWPASHKPLLNNVQQVTGERDEPRSHLRTKAYIAVACGVLGVSDRAQKRGAFLLRAPR